MLEKIPRNTNEHTVFQYEAIKELHEFTIELIEDDKLDIIPKSI